MNTKKRFLLASLLILSACLITACTSTPAPTTATTSQGVQSTTAKPASTTAQAQGSTVSIESFAFNPATLPVKAGTTVVWTNNDSVAHNIKSTGFNSPTMAKGQTFEFKFDTKGTFEYSCGIHPSMTGKIVVE
ncbi:MAG TPA: cupredoxin family copper-binding protein [Clostridia bacterium]